MNDEPLSITIIITVAIFTLIGLILFYVGSKKKKRNLWLIGFSFLLAAGVTIFVESAEIRGTLTALAVVIAVLISARSFDESRKLRKETMDREIRDRKERLEREKRERKIQLLNEIRDWVFEVKGTRQEFPQFTNLPHGYETLNWHARLYSRVGSLGNSYMYILKISIDNFPDLVDTISFVGRCNILDMVLLSKRMNLEVKMDMGIAGDVLKLMISKATEDLAKNPESIDKLESDNQLKIANFTDKLLVKIAEFKKNMLDI